MFRRHLALLAILSLLVPFATGCNRGSGKLKVAFVTNNAADFWKIAEAGCRKAEKELDVEVLVRMPPNGTAAEQKEYIDSLLNQGIKGVAVSVIDPKNQTNYIQRIAKQVTLITQDNDAPESGRLCYIGTDNYEAGKAVGKLVKEAMPDGGTVGLFVGQVEPLNAQQRRNGVLDELAGDKVAESKGATPGQYGKYKLTGVYTDEAKESIALEKSKFFLNATQDEPNVCGVGLWAYNAPALQTALTTHTGKNKANLKIVAFDEMQDTLRGIEQGTISGTVVQDPFGFGYESVKLLVAIAKGEKKPADVEPTRYVKHRVITKDGRNGTEAVATFQAELNERLGIQPPQGQRD